MDCLIKTNVQLTCLRFLSYVSATINLVVYQAEFLIVMKILKDWILFIVIYKFCIFWKISKIYFMLFSKSHHALFGSCVVDVFKIPRVHVTMRFFFFFSFNSACINKLDQKQNNQISL
ncbi:hypothetical protein V1514DRAFT_332518, partial [Lipomyces japonicus]|uniref:uncharacterized protein n=1 Tax=Lipomyces japonicus TaxID=56871 RepID=UPI0034CE8F77